MTSHRQIFKSSAIVGGASAITMVIGIVKVKVLAVLLGPSGVGLMGLYQNIMGMASTLSGCGVATSGVRQLAASGNDANTLALVRRVLWISNLCLGLIGMIVLWLLKEPVAQWVFGNTDHAGAVAWLALGVFLSLVAGSQTALLQGLRRIGDLARVNVYGALLGATVGIAAVYFLKEEGIIWFVLAAPAVSILVAWHYASRLPRTPAPYDWLIIHQQWQAMLKLGVPLMIASLFTLATQLIARSIILRDLGLEASGYFQAVWTISMTYIAFVLGAMAKDFYPRLSEAIGDHERAGRLVNEQAEMALLLAGPVLLGMITFAPWVIHLLYAESFSPAAEVLRWQILGDIIKVASWPMGFIILAMGRGSIFIVTEMIWNVTYIATLTLGLGDYGLVAAGFSFWWAYLVIYGVIMAVSMKLIGYKPTRYVLVLSALLLLAGGVIVFVANLSPILCIWVGGLITLAMCTYSWRKLDSLLDLRAMIRNKLAKKE